MPQELHVVQCYSCQMYQVDIVKKVQTWTCKICREKQSLKKVLFKGSGKDCRLNVQKLNELKGINDQNYQFAGIHQLSSAVDGATMEPIQNKWSKFIESSDENNDSSGFEVVNGPSSAHNEFQGESNWEVTQTNHSIQKKEKTNSKSMCNDFIDNKVKDDALSNRTEEYNEPVNKKRKVDNEMSVENKWSKYLPDELSDESN